MVNYKGVNFCKKNFLVNAAAKAPLYITAFQEDDFPVASRVQTLCYNVHSLENVVYARSSLWHFRCYTKL